MEIKNKKDVIEDMLAKGDTMICIDSRHDEIQVPYEYRDKVDLRLILNLNFRHEIRVLTDGIEAELLFSGTAHSCWIPYDCLWSAYNPETGEGYLWPGQLPHELHDLFYNETKGQEEVKSQPRLTAHEGTKKPRAKGRPGPSLRIIPGGKK